uniref:Uncharacterized protein n=1 Tax=Panagrolaimus sp. JU765 TaxID=591449 RepID=A0AC34Q496_9BILA
MSTINRQTGLRRTYLSENDHSNHFSGKTDYSGFKNDESEQQLTFTCEKIQSQLLVSVEKLLSLSEQVDGRNDRSREQLQYYQEKIWPEIEETDLQINWLGNSVRDGINSCKIDERKLSILLEINKFQIEVQKIIQFLAEFGEELEDLLQLRQRGICGITLKVDLLDLLRRNHSKLRMKILHV